MLYVCPQQQEAAEYPDQARPGIGGFKASFREVEHQKRAVGSSWTSPTGRQADGEIHRWSNDQDFLATFEVLAPDAA